MAYGVADSLFRCSQFGLTTDGVNPLSGAAGTQTGIKPLPNPTEDPGRLYDVGRYIDLFTKPKYAGGLKDDPNDIILVAIAGPVVDESILVKETLPCFDNQYISSCPAVSLSCGMPVDSSPIFANPSVRIAAVVNSATNHILQSVCVPPYSTALDSLSTYIGKQIGLVGSCLPGSLADRTASCTVVDSVTGESDNVETRTLPECVSARPDAIPCWSVITDSNCPIHRNAQQLSLVICRENVNCVVSDIAPVGTTTQASCQLASL